MKLDSKIKFNAIYDVSTMAEEDVTWEMQNQIHRLLNYAFKDLSVKFIAKTYGYERPEFRILGFEGDKIVGHMGARRDIFYLAELKYHIYKLGLWGTNSATKGWGTEICRASMEFVKNQGCKLAIGMTNNPVIINYIVPKFENKIRLFDIQLQGEKYTSKADTKFMLFNIGFSDDEFDQISDELSKYKTVRIKGEPF